MPVAVELSRIVISEINNHQAIFLREVGGRREFPIVIGIFEATSIDRRVKGIKMARPLTHELLSDTIRELGGVVEDIFIRRVEDQTYFASIRIRQGENIVEVDARPSDAIALSIYGETRVPILVKDSVFKHAMEMLNS
ncbi:MAG: bifunctional nuclease family protein [Thermoguttaceae bacterium]